MEVLQWKSIDGVDVKIMVAQPCPDLLGDSMTTEFVCEFRSNVGSQRKRFPWGNTVANRDDIVSQRRVQVFDTARGVCIHLIAEGEALAAPVDKHQLL